MAILETDIKLLASQVMDDVPEGGGAPTGTVIADGASNGIFPDISDVDRAYGNVSMRKIFVAVQTPDVDTYYGARVLVEDAPDDPLVSATLFTTGEVFDTRADAQALLEQYLAPGPAFPANLYGTHYTGMQALQLWAHEDADLPRIGQTLVLVRDPGKATEYRQYVRITNASGAVQSFDYSSGGSIIAYKRLIISCEISDPLRVDFAGEAIRPYDIDSPSTAVNTTVVADSARYYGVSRLAQAITTGDITCRVDSIYSQLVPSAQTDRPVTGATPNGSVAALQPGSSSAVSFSTSAVLSPTASIYLGGAIMPGTLSIVAGSNTFTDQGGALRLAGSDVGTIDYANGIVSLATDGGTYSGSKTISFQPAGAPVVATQTMSLPVTAENRSASWVAVLDPVPAPGTLVLSFMAMGRWYTLQDNGTGNVKGAETGYGSGALNGMNLQVTLGALPDVGSALLLSWADQSASSGQPAGPAQTSPAYVLLALGQPVDPSAAITVTWSDAGTARTTAGNADGSVTVVDATAGVVRLYPNVLPAHDATYAITWTVPTSITDDETGGTDTQWQATFPGPIIPKTFRGVIGVTHTYTSLETFGDATTTTNYTATDNNGDGILWIDGVQVGSINYTTGACTLQRSFANLPVYNDPVIGKRTILGATSYTVVGYTTRHVAGSIVGAVQMSATYTLDGVSGTQTANLAPAEVRVDLSSVATYRAQGAVAGSLMMTLAGQQVRDDTASPDVISTDASSGATTKVGSIDRAGLVVALTSWAAGASPIASLQSLLVTRGGPTVSRIDARTPVAPLRPSSFTISARLPDDTLITATSDGSGNIDGSASGTPYIKGSIDYDTGVFSVEFLTAGRSVTTSTYGSGTGSSYNGYSDATPTGSSTASTEAALVQAASIRISCVGYTYLPLDADLLGLDPVRLPQDGRVPIFRPSNLVQIMHTADTAPQTVANGNVIDCGRVRLSRVRLIGNDGNVITTGYSADLDAGTVTITDASGFSQPVHVAHTIADLALVSEAQITGQLAFARSVTHDYPVGATVSSCLILGDSGNLHARVSTLFDQATWTNVYADAVIGSAAAATFNDISYPVTVSNDGAVTERWALIFTNSTSFNVFGEHVGQVAAGNVTSDCGPLNPATGKPYFTVPALGWGAGWSAGNVLRFNTVGAVQPVWCVRTIRQGPATVSDDSFSVGIFGNVDHP